MTVKHVVKLTEIIRADEEIKGLVRHIFIEKVHMKTNKTNIINLDLSFLSITRRL